MEQAWHCLAASVVSETRRANLDSGQSKPRRWWPEAVAVGLLAASVVASSVWWFETRHVPADRDRQIAVWRDRLSAIADDRRFALDRWLADGLRDARSIARYPGLHRALERVAGGDGIRLAPSSAGELGELLAAVIAEERFRSGAVVTPSGAILARAAAGAAVGPDALVSAARTAVGTGTVFVDVVRSHDGSLGLLFAAPVARSSVGRALGALVLEVDPGTSLFPLLGADPGPTASGETLLARAESGRVVYIAPSRLGRAAPLEMKEPLGTPALAMSAALRGDERFGEFSDHRGSSVFAVTRRLRTVPWGLVVKVDRDEALELHRRRARDEAWAGAILEVALAALGFALWRWRGAAAAARRYASRERIALLLGQANDAILFIGPDGRIRENNLRADEFYGVGSGELAGRHVADLRAEDERQGAPEHFARALAGSVRFETVHLRSDGSRIPVEVSSRAVLLDGETSVVSIVRDISAHRDAEVRLRRLNRLYRTLSAVNQLIVRGADRAALFEGVCRILGEVGGFPLTWLALKGAGGAVAIAARSGSAGAYLDGIEVRWDDSPLGRGPTGCAIREGHSVVVPEFEKDPRLAPWSERAARFGLRSSGAFPVRAGGEVIGALMIYGAELATLGAEEEELASELAGEIGFALDRLADVEARRSLEEKLRAVFEGDVIGILFGDVHGRVLDANDAYLRLIGYSREELQRGEVRWTTITPPEHRPADARGMVEARERGSCTPYEKEYVRRDGTRTWVLVGYVLLGPARQQSVAFVLDISERKRVEAALQASEACTRAIVETAVDGIITIDERGLIESFNPAAERLFGYQAGEVLGQPVSRLMPSPHSDEHGAYLARYLRTGDRRVIGVGRWLTGRRKDGTEFPLELAVAEFQVGGKRAFAGIARDLSERRRLEEQFRQSQKMEAVGRLAGGVAHDFNNLLGVIAGYSEMASRQLAEDHPARARIAEVTKAAEHAAGLTRQLLAFSRRQVLAPKILDLNALLEDLERMLQRLIGEDVELVVRLGAGLGAVRVDPGQIGQVVLNLAVNARDAMPRGGQLTIETAEADAGEFTAAAAWRIEPGRYVRLRVSDTGSGMDEATLARVFEPFFTTKPAGKGTGLGLATVYGIVKQSGGHVFVESALGRGTQFSIYLPRVAEVMAGVAPEGLAELAQPGETILLVEDQESLREVVREILVDLGYQVLAAGGGEAALALAREHRGQLHLLLSDVVMPEMSGSELAARLVALRPGLKVLFMSGYTSEVLGRHGAVGPAIQLIEKPFTRQALARRMRQVLLGRG